VLPNTLLEAKSQTSSSAFSARLHFPGSILARFLELRGGRIVKDCGAIWYAGPGHFLMSLPYQAILNPDPSALRHMIRETGAFGARFPSTSWTGVPSGLYVMRSPDYDIDSVDVIQRDRVRHGLQHFYVRPATKAQLLSQGLSLNLRTMARQGRYDPEFGNRRRWETLVEAAFACSEISFPAAFSGPRLAAYMITCREQRWLHILRQMSCPEDLPNFPNHVLTHMVTKQAASDENLDAICYGYVPLCAAGGLHEYKLGLGYEMIPHRSAIQLHPALDRILNSSVARAAVRAARALCRQDRQLETLETVLQGAHVSGPPI
jgi:hypothetical protein